MIRTQVYIPDDLLAEAKLQAGFMGVNLSEFIRRSLKSQIIKDQKIPNNKFSLKQYAGIIKEGGFDSKAEDLSDNIDCVVYE